MHSLKIHFRLLVAFTAVAASAQTIEHEKDREHWQRVEEMFKAMQVHAGSVVADVGAGDGFLTVRLSPLVGDTGRVYASDIDEKRLERLPNRVGEPHLDNIVIVKGDADDPHLPAVQLDVVVILNSYHEMPKCYEMLQHIRDCLKPGGRLVIAEPSPKPAEETRDAQIAKHHISSAFVAEEMTRAGFSVVDRRDDFAQLPGGSGSYSLVVGLKK